MARSYAKIHVDIWSDQDFLALGRDAMVTYLFLLAQPKMRSCGVIDMQANRWAKKLDMSTEELASALNLLDAHRFVAIDYTTDELAVRTFVKHDAGDTKNWPPHDQRTPRNDRHPASTRPDSADRRSAHRR